MDTDKTVFMPFHKRQRTLSMNKSLTNINGDSIPLSTHIKFLGVIIDNNLTCKPHINYIATKISIGVGILRHLRKESSKNILNLICNTLIIPYFIRACTCYKCFLLSAAVFHLLSTPYFLSYLFVLFVYFLPILRCQCINVFTHVLLFAFSFYYRIFNL